MVKKYSQGPKWIPGTIEEQTGPVSYRATTEDGVKVKRHNDQVLIPEKNSNNKPDMPSTPSPPPIQKSSRISRAPVCLDL